MESISDQSPLIVIVGQTASGKSALALDLAHRFNGEIIAADARSIYRGMNIGTAKPTQEEREAVPHHLIDIVSPKDIFTVADFKRLAQDSITSIAKHGRLPVLVGGSGLYIYSVIYDFSFRVPNPEERKRLEGLSVEELQSLIGERGISMPTNSKNPRHLISSLETGTIIRGQNHLRPNTLLLGLDIAADKLERNIRLRTEAMVDAGLESEVRKLVGQYGWENAVLRQTIGYEEFKPYFDGSITSQNEIITQIQQDTRRLAKRQKTWFKRNRDIHWISNSEQAVDLVTTFMNK